jgi:DNA-binding transcriptional LysR family regulator
MAIGYSSNNLEVFVDAVKLNSFSAVARRRGLTAISVARQVSALEKELGISLFNRTTRSLTLTAAGRTLFDRAGRILDELEEAKLEATSHQKEARGLLRVSCWPTFGKKHIIPHLRSLMDEHPKLQVDLDLSERLHEPAFDRSDLIFRIGDLRDSTLIATRFAQQRGVFVASPEYLERHGTPKTLADCPQHRLIEKRHFASVMGWRMLLGETRAIFQKYVFQTDDLEAQLDACIDGLGIAHLPDWVVYDKVASGEVNTLPIDLGPSTTTATIFILRNQGPISAAAEAFTSHIRKCVGAPPVWTTLQSPKTSRRKRK